RSLSAAIASIEGEVYRVQAHEALVPEQAQLAAEYVSMDQHFLPGEASGGLVEAAAVLNDVVLGDAALVSHDEARGELLLAVGKEQLARVGLPALSGCLPIEALVRTVVVAFQKVLQAKLERAQVRVDVGSA